jgi:hypothetical protein
MHGGIDYGYGFFLARGQGVQANCDHIKGLGRLAAESVLADNA